MTFSIHYNILVEYKKIKDKHHAPNTYQPNITFSLVCLCYQISGSFQHSNLFNEHLMKKKLVFDLDQTLVHVSSFEERGPADILRYSSDMFPLHIYLRNNLIEFMNWAKEKFEVSIVTARSRDSAKIVLESLNWNFPLTTRESLIRTEIKGWEAFAKPIDNAIVVEDQPEVVFGDGNTVLEIQPFFAIAPDNELARIKSELEKLLHD